MSEQKKTSLKSRRYSLIFTTIVACLSVFTLGVSTYAWYQANADVQIHTESEEATITVSKPDDAKFYYFKGNGDPGTPSSYVGYSLSTATVGTKTNVVDSSGNLTTSSINNVPIDFDTHFQEINDEGNNTANKCLNLSYIRPGCYYTFCVTYKTGAAINLTLGQMTGNRDGGDTTPYRYLGTSGTEPLSLAQAINSYSYNTTSKANAISYVKQTLGVAMGLSFQGDGGNPYNSSSNKYGIGYDGETAASKSIDFTVHHKDAETDQLYYIFFTIYMESDGTNALVFSSTNSDNNKRYYTKNSSGNYFPYDGLSISMSSIAIS